MVDIHPAASAWPVPLLSVAILFWILDARSPGAQFGSARRIVVACAVLGIILSFGSGYRASEYAEGTFVYPEDALSVHHLWGKISLFLGTVLAIFSWIEPRAKFNRTRWKTIVLIFLVLTLGAAATTSWRGGKAVFEHGAGVRAPIKAIKE